MKIVQINAVCGKGSTGRLAVDIATEAESQGHQCYIAYGHGSTKYKHSYKIGNRIEHLLHNIVFSRILGLQGYGSVFTTLKFTNWLRCIKPDIIHIHNLHANYINYRILFRYIRKHNLPVIFTLHDCLNFTGKCTNFTSASCVKWKTECNKCPLFRQSGVPSLFFDRSTKMFRDKKRTYSRLEKCKSFAVSKWLRDQALESILDVKDGSVGYIYNWIDYDVFKPSTDEMIVEFRSKYNLSDKHKYLISVSQDWSLSEIRTQDALRIAEKLPEEFRLILVGRMYKQQTLPPNIIHIPYISSQSELATAYSVAFAYIHLSIQDTFGLVIGEAMACGTIPITYNSTACAETPSNFGIIVPPRDTDAIINALPLIEQKRLHSQEMIDFVKATYDKKTNINKYIEEYQQLAEDEVQCNSTGL